MTIATQLSKVTYAGNGVTTAFPVPFPFLKEADLTVVARAADGTQSPRLCGTHYALSGAGGPNGGSLTMFAPPQTGETLVICRIPAIVQEVDYVENSAFPAETHEAALDLLTMICQALDEKLGRAVLYPLSTPAAEVRASTDFLNACESARDQALAAGSGAQASAVQAAASAQGAAAAATQALQSVAGVRCTSQDQNPGSLFVKIAAGDGLAETLLNPGANESLRFDLALDPTPGLETVSGRLRAKVSAGGGLARTSQGLGLDLTNGTTLRPAMVAGRVFNHAFMGGL